MAELALDATHALRVTATGSGLRAEPVTASGDAWVRSTPGDGAGLAVLRRLRDRRAVEDGFRVTTGTWVAADDESERAMGVDQTNESWVVGGRVVVKWVTDDLDGPQAGADRLRRLADAGFTQSPALVGLLEWHNPGGDWVPVVVVQELLAEAEDGWTWAVSECRRAVGLEPGEATPFGTELGRLTARMHLALASGPAATLSESLVAAHHEDARQILADAIELTAVSAPASHALLLARREEIERDLAGLLRLAHRPAYPVHGDFHVGQVLRTPDGRLHVVDFDGNPTRPSALRAGPDVVERDLAGMCQSLENVGHVVRHHAPGVDNDAVDAWVRQVQGDFLAAWRGLALDRFGYDEAAHQVFDLEQVCRELVYAARHLPAWGYVPAAVLRGRFR